MDPVAGGLTRAAVWTGAGVDMRDVAVPRLGARELLVRVRLATVCGSDLHTVTGRRPGPRPSVLGHEAVGDVVAAGPGAGTVVGARIVWTVTASCGACDRCESGRSAKCRSLRKVGHEPFDGAWALSGAYARYIVLPAGVGVVRVPDPVPDVVAAPAACATATAVAAVEAAGDVAGRRVLVCGAGMLGVTAIALCAEAGADVRVADPDAERIAVAERFGGVGDEGGPVDVALDFSGSAAAVGECLRRLDVGGRLVLAGSVMPGPSVSLDPEAVVRGWLTVTGVHNYEPAHLHRAVEFLARTAGTYPWDELVAEPVRLDDLAKALRRPDAPALRTSVAP
ncbi:zinc-binding dehydrogenase [Rhodococcus sp. CSLK01-03]|uniref:Zinc-binding dehydrogenase n=1 Tax=Rhodococcus indonesiensis TaxID=3055869 RepID=A0ABT7RNV6_9NOCA|nr:zinc-binding dehydrogenase [Rhodococcus indonesiensis]MDM7489320.1 zinc-binding dehydrogenase [Rhodococcus indonesiensis]